MIIKSIELENIRSYKEETIEFEDGINFLSGDIGSGKSSILYAIEFALLGFKRGDLEGFQLLRKGANKGSIKLTIINTNTQKSIEITRNLKKTKNSELVSQDNGSILIDDNLIELSPTELNSYIFSFLNFPKEFLTKDKNLIYRFTIYTPQEQLKEILFTSPDKRLEIIRKIFGIDKYKQLRDAIDIYFNQVRDKKKVFQTKLEPKEELKKELKSYKIDIDKHKKDLLVLTKQENLLNQDLEKTKIGVDKRNEVVDKIRKNILILEKKKTKFEEIEESIKELKKTISKKQKILEDITNQNNSDKIVDLNKQIDKINSQIKVLQKNKKKCQNKLKGEEVIQKAKSNLEESFYNIKTKQNNFIQMQKSCDYMLVKCQIKDIENAIQKDIKVNKKFDKLQLKSKELEKNLIENQSKIVMLNEDIIARKKSISNISELAVCENCLQDVSVEHKNKMQKKLEDEINILQKQVDNLNDDNKLKKKEFEKMQENLNTLGLIEKDLIKKEEKLENLKEQKLKERKVYDELKILKDELKLLDILSLNKQKDELNIELEKFKTIREEIEELGKQEIILNKQVSVFELKISKINNKLKEKENIIKDISAFESDLKSKQTIIERKQDNLDKLNDYINKEKTINSKKEELSVEVEKLYQKLQNVSNSKSSKQTQIEGLDKLIVTNSDNLKLLDVLEVEYKDLLDKEFFLENKVINILGIIEKSAFTKYYSSFSIEFEKLFRTLIEDNDIEVRLNSEFTPVIEQNGFDVDVKNLSGGEKSSLALAYRLGLKKIIENSLKSNQELSMLILDEPTDGFSNEQIDRLGNILKDSNMKQIILVSHDEKIEAIADNVLKVNKVNHISIVE